MSKVFVELFCPNCLDFRLLNIDPCYDAKIKCRKCGFELKILSSWNGVVNTGSEVCKQQRYIVQVKGESIPAKTRKLLSKKIGKFIASNKRVLCVCWDGDIDVKFIKVPDDI